MFVSCKALFSSVVWLLLESNKPGDVKKKKKASNLQQQTLEFKPNKEGLNLPKVTNNYIYTLASTRLGFIFREQYSKSS